MSKCTKCGTEFEAKFCPNCGTPAEQPNVAAPQQQSAYAKPPKKKKLKWWQILLIILGALVAIGIISNLVNGDSTPTSTEATEAKESKSTTAPKTKDTYNVGEPAIAKDAELTVTKVEKSKGKKYSEPKEGMEFVIVTVKYKNKGAKDTISYNPYDFKLQNSKGQITSQTFTTIDTDTALSSGDLAPGGEISGTIAFEAPIGDKGLILQYTNNIFSTNSKINFKLN